MLEVSVIASLQIRLNKGLIAKLARINELRLESLANKGLTAKFVQIKELGPGG
jgi:hypothetical protein